MPESPPEDSRNSVHAPRPKFSTFFGVPPRGRPISGQTLRDAVRTIFADEGSRNPALHLASEEAKP